ncbi:MAG: lipoprotein LipL21 [Leptospiraceae bacterium]|nr:lipoprotein LipL21 [Leptospiraceae bacterium]MDW7976173.1 lipoprotein LipL21 [Leptospiraceae bacterium]
MKKLIFFVAIGSVLLTYCGSKHEVKRDATTVGKEGWVFEGWACAPDATKAKEGLSPAKYCKEGEPKEYLYMKFSAAASEKAIRSGRIAQMMATCRDAALTQIKGDGLSKIIGDYLEQASGVQDGQSTGIAIVRQSKGIIQGVGLYDCCAIDNDTGTCVEPGEKEDWSQCLCVGYLRFPGGQKAFESLARQVSAQ